MRLRASTICCTVSFFLCIALVALWVRSFWVADYVTFRGTYGLHEVSSELGSIQYTLSPGDGSAGVWYTAIRGPAAYHLLDHINIWGQWRWNPRDGSPRRFPLCVLVAIAAVLPIAWLRSFGVPRWIKGIVPWMIALWPFEVRPFLSDSVEIGASDVLMFWLVSFLIGLVILFTYDQLDQRILSRHPWPWQLSAKKRRRRQVAGLCGNCGYDLRASSERCPECGGPIDHALTSGKISSAPTKANPDRRIPADHSAG
jgi:hypothetical protein